jgi:hypothetical protein
MAAKKKRGRPPKNPPAQPPAAAAVDDAAQPGLARDVNEDEDENEGGMGTLEDGADAQQTLAQLLAEEVPPETQPEHLQTQQGGGWCACTSRAQRKARVPVIAMFKISGTL